VRSRARLARVAAAAAAWLGANGCVISHPDYPASWSPLVGGATCSVLTGTYEDRGVEGETGAGMFRGQAVSLSRMLFPGETSLLAASGDYRCRVGAAEISSTALVGEQVTGAQSDAFKLSKAGDGSLVLKHSTSGFGLIVVIPVGGSEDRWFRFKLRVD
jgi:hypothetical protein